MPHLQNTGGFFVAALEKKRRLPWEKDPIKKDAVVKKTEEATATEKMTATEEETVADSTKQSADAVKSEDKSVAAPWGPQRKRRRIQGYKEDPYIFFKEDETVWKTLKSFYSLSDSFNPICLLTRSHSDKKKNIYFCSEAVRDLLRCNEDSIKIINTGVKTFVRCDNRNMRCSYRYI